MDNPYYDALPTIFDIISENSGIELLGEYPDLPETPSITPSMAHNLLSAPKPIGGGGGGITPDPNIVAASAFNRGTGNRASQSTYRIDLCRGFFIETLGKSL